MPAYAVSGAVPGHVTPELRFDYDVHAPGLPGSDFHLELYKLKRTAPPVFWTPFNGGHWYVTDARLAREMLSEPEVFSNRNTTLPLPETPREGFIPVALDPPEHQKYRGPLSLGLSRKAVAELEPGVRALAVDLIEELKPRGRVRVHGRLRLQAAGHHLPAAVRPAAGRPRLAAGGGRPVDAPGRRQGGPAGTALQVPLRLHQRARAEPGADLISWLGEREIDGDRISEAKLLNMCTLLLIGGLESVSNTVGFLGKFLAENPEHRRQIREAPAILGAAVEEMLRRFPTTAVGTGRYCIKDARLGEVEIKAGDMLMTSTP